MNTIDRLDQIDNNLNHLYNPFREKLRQIFLCLEIKTDRRWMVVEGYRTPERQFFLYGSGRPELSSRPPYYGRKGPLLTKMRHPTYHGAGMAADCAPMTLLQGRYLPVPDYTIPFSWWEEYRTIYTRFGLTNPAWELPDRQHVQMSDPATLHAAQLWVRAGMRAPKAEERIATETWEPLALYLDGLEIFDAGAYRDTQEGKIYARLRPAIDHLLGVISAVTLKEGSGTARCTVPADDSEWTVPVHLDPQGHAVFALHDLIHRLSLRFLLTPEKGRIDLWQT